MLPHSPERTAHAYRECHAASPSNRKDAKHAGHCGICSAGFTIFLVNLYILSLRSTIVASELSPDLQASSASCMNFSIFLRGVVMKIGAAPLYKTWPTKWSCGRVMGKGLPSNQRSWVLQGHRGVTEVPLIQQHNLLALQAQKRERARRSMMVNEIFSEDSWKRIEKQRLAFPALQACQA